MPRVEKFLWMFILSFPAFSIAAAPPSQIELNGFQLGQFEQAATKQFGKPLDERTTPDNWIYRIYKIDERTRMVFKYPPLAKDEKNRLAISLQVFGDPSNKVQPFLGIRLGDPSSKVKEQLGAPKEIKKTEDAGVGMKFEVHDYFPERNFSVEIDAATQRVFSILIFGYYGIPERPPEAVPSLKPFIDALAKRDVNALLQELTPDVAISRGGKWYVYEKGARESLEAQSDIRAALLDGPNSVRGALVGESPAVVEKHLKDSEGALRIIADKGVGHVIKFKDGPIIEIVYWPHAGRWKVWEIFLK